MASVGPLLVWGWSKWARISLDRRLSVLPSVMICLREPGTPSSLRRSISACIWALLEGAGFFGPFVVRGLF